MGLKIFKPSLAPTGKSAATDQRQTSCKICRYGIYQDQERVWSMRPLGLVHAWCAPAVGRG